MPSSWEKLYAGGEQLNRYPFSSVVSKVLHEKAENSQLRVLEIGCGAGNNIVFMAAEGLDVSGIDISDTALSYAKERLKDRGLSAELIKGDFTSLPWENNQFDLVVDRCALSCVAKHHIFLAIKEVNRVLKNGGKMYSEMYAKDHHWFKSAVEQFEGYVTNFDGRELNKYGGLFFANRVDISELFSPFSDTSINCLKLFDDKQNIQSSCWQIEAVK